MHNDDLLFSHMITDNFYKYYHCDSGGSPFVIKTCGHHYLKMYLFLEGTSTQTIDSRTYKFRPNDILLVSSKDIYCQAVSFPAPLYEYIILWVHIDFFRHIKQIGEDLTACFQDAFQNKYCLFHPDSTNLSRLLHACSRIEREQSMDAPGNRILIYSYIIEILTLLNRAYFKKKDTPAEYEEITENELINQSLAYINKHLSEDLSLETIAAQFFISKNYFSHQFKLHTGYSPYQYIIKKRLKAAYDMLSKGINASAACETCGFTDYSNFLKAFRREFGKNPSDIKKSS